VIARFVCCLSRLASRFSFNDLPAFLPAGRCGDLSGMAIPLVDASGIVSASRRLACWEQDRPPCGPRRAHACGLDSFSPVRELSRCRHRAPGPASREEPRVTVVASHELDRPLVVASDERRLGFVHMPQYSRSGAVVPRKQETEPSARSRPSSTSARFVFALVVASWSRSAVGVSKYRKQSICKAQ
jgi:hypothetical protein